MRKSFKGTPLPNLSRGGVFDGREGRSDPLCGPVVKGKHRGVSTSRQTYIPTAHIVLC